MRKFQDILSTHTHKHRQTDHKTNDPTISSDHADQQSSMVILHFLLCFQFCNVLFVYDFMTQFFMTGRILLYLTHQMYMYGGLARMMWDGL